MLDESPSRGDLALDSLMRSLMLTRLVQRYFGIYRESNVAKLMTCEDSKRKQKKNNIGLKFEFLIMLHFSNLGHRTDAFCTNFHLHH